MATMNQPIADGRHQESSDEISAREFEIETSSALATIDRTETLTEIATAKKYPRSIQKFQREALTLATLDEETAKATYYRVPRDGKYIEGGSIRLAEIVASSWTNLRIAARVLDIDDKFVTAQAVGYDLEKNYKVSVEIRRGITNKYGRVYTPDMIRTTAQAAMSIALRNAIFRIVPVALVKSVLDEAKKVSLGKGQTMEQRRERAFKAMASVGAKTPDVLRVLGKRGLEDIDVDDLINMNGMFQAIKDGEATWASIVQEFEASQPKTEEDIKRDLKTELDDVEIVADSVEEPPAGGGDALTGSELGMVKALFASAAGTNTQKMGRVKKVLPYFTGAESLKRTDIEAYTKALEATE